jgi:hypothetical protein
VTGQALVRHKDPPVAHHDFASLLTPAQWYRLPAPIRRRFSNDFCPGRTVCYRGEVVKTRLSRLGWALAQLTRLIGAPLPLSQAAGMATVVVSDHPGNAGQVWSRLYHRPAGAQGFPQAIHSVKRFAGPTGLEEYLGWGFSMALELRAEGTVLAFVGQRYFLSFAGRRMELPRWLCPGVLRVVHAEEADGWFTFTMSLDHPRFGRLVYQQARFRDDVALR